MLKSEVFKCICVCSCETEGLWLVTSELERVGSLALFLKELLLSPQLLHLVLGVCLLIGCLALEWKGVVGVLWVLLVEDVVLSVVPVDETGLVTA